MRRWRPTAWAARASVPSVTESFSGSSRRFKLRAACFHARRELGLRNFLAPHQFVELPHEHTLDRPRGTPSEPPSAFRESTEGGSVPAFFGLFLATLFKPHQTGIA